MVRIGYSGHMNTFRIRVASGIINRWNKDEIRDFSETDAELLLANKDFYIVGERSEKKVEEKKTPETVSTSTIEKDENEEECFFEKVNSINIDTASKDELLDYTALNGIIADYTMTVAQLRKLIKKEMDLE